MIDRNLGKTGIQVSEVGLGGEYLEGKDYGTVEQVVHAAMDGGVNILDCFMSNPEIRSNLGRALEGRRDRMIIQGHFRSVWKDNQYGRTLEIGEVKAHFEDLLRHFRTDYMDIGMIHMIDNESDYSAVFNGEILEYAQEMKRKGVIRCLGLSSHNPVLALRAVRTGLIDVLLFSINPAYDVMDENAPRPKKMDNGLFNDWGLDGGINRVREELYRECEKAGVGITVMKCLGAGALLSEKTSPFCRGMTAHQCMRYALDRPAVASVLIGMQSLENVKDCLAYEEASPAETDYSDIFATAPKFSMSGRCMYCNHCLPCAAHINIAQVNKYLDLAAAAGNVTPSLREHYAALEHKASECIQCGRCEKSCPFDVRIMERMKQARTLFE